MRAVLAFLVVLSVLTLPSGTIAQQADQDRETSVVNDGVVHEACFGDRYESDDDMNDGNTITDEEILLILNPPAAKISSLPWPSKSPPRCRRQQA